MEGVGLGLSLTAGSVGCLVSVGVCVGSSVAGVGAETAGRAADGQEIDTAAVGAQLGMSVFCAKFCKLGAGKIPTGFAAGEAASALADVGRLQHGTRHLVEKKVITSWAGKTSPTMIRETLTPILEHPSATFDHALGQTAVKGFLGEIKGQQVAVFIYKEGKDQGKLATSFVPTPNQLNLWGLGQ